MCSDQFDGFVTLSLLLGAISRAAFEPVCRLCILYIPYILCLCCIITHDYCPIFCMITSSLNCKITMLFSATCALVCFCCELFRSTLVRVLLRLHKIYGAHKSHMSNGCFKSFEIVQKWAIFAPYTFVYSLHWWVWLRFSFEKRLNDYEHLCSYSHMFTCWWFWFRLILQRRGEGEDLPDSI